MFLSRNKKIDVYPCKPQFCYIKVGLKGVNIIYACFRDGYPYGPFHSKTGSPGIYGQQMPRSACTSAQSDQDLRCSLLESFDTIECINKEQW